MSLVGKVALVTGASRGIGRSIAQRLGRGGAAVVVNYSGSEPQARETAAIEKAGGRAVAVRADVSQVVEVQRLFDATLEHFGKLEILVNNAGVILYKPLVEVTEEEFDRLFAVNVKGTYFAFQQAAKRMRDGVRIITGRAESHHHLLIPTDGPRGASRRGKNRCGD